MFQGRQTRQAYDVHRRGLFGSLLLSDVLPLAVMMSDRGNNLLASARSRFVPVLNPRQSYITHLQQRSLGKGFSLDFGRPMRDPSSPR